jgi:hypothetical protein
MPPLHEKVMFEIYRETAYGNAYRVVYFTELGERNREHEINRAMAGEYYLDGFLDVARLADAKSTIDEVLARLNAGEALPADAAAALLQPFLSAE